DVLGEAIMLCDQLTGVDDAYSCRNLAGAGYSGGTSETPRLVECSDRLSADKVRQWATQQANTARRSRTRSDPVQFGCRARTRCISRSAVSPSGNSSTTT